MKNLTSILSILSFIGVLILFYFQFSEAEKVEQTGEQNLTIPAKEDRTSGDKIVYVDLEKLLLNYQYSKDLNDQSMLEKESLEAKLQKELDLFDQEMQSYQSKLARGGFINVQSAENKKNELVLKQQELQELQIDLEDQWFQKQTELEQKLYDSIVNFLTEVSLVNDYQFVLSQVAGSDVLVANPELDITDFVVENLNKRYKSNK